MSQQSTNNIMLQTECTILFNEEEEMLEIRNHNNETVFCGNTWDLHRDADNLKYLFESLGLCVKIEEFSR